MMPPSAGVPGAARVVACTTEGDLVARLAGWAACGAYGVLGRVTAGRDTPNAAARCFANTLIQRTISLHLCRLEGADAGGSSGHPVAVCTRAPTTTPGELRTRLKYALPGLRVIQRSLAPGRVVGVLRELAEIGDDPALRQCLAHGGQEVLNCAAAIVGAVGRSTPTLLVLTGVGAGDLAWLTSPPPPSVRVCVFVHDRSDHGGRGSSVGAAVDCLANVAHFAPAGLRRRLAGYAAADGGGRAWGESWYHQPFDDDPLGRQLAVLAANPHAGCAKLLAKVTECHASGSKDAVWSGPMQGAVRRAVLEAVADAVAAAAGAERPAVDATLRWVVDLVTAFPGVLTVEQLASLVAHLWGGAQGGALSAPCPGLVGLVRRAVEVLAPGLAGGRPDAFCAGREESVVGDARNPVQLASWGQRDISAPTKERVLEWLSLPEQRGCPRLWVDVGFPLLKALGRLVELDARLRDWPTLSWLYRHRGAADVSRALSRRGASATEVAAAVLSDVDNGWRDVGGLVVGAAEYACRARSVGLLASQAGCFDLARDVLSAAAEAAAAAQSSSSSFPSSPSSPSTSSSSTKAELLLAQALNEIRYWDERRDWSSEGQLALLGESAERAVSLLRAGGRAASFHLSFALSAVANHRFKLACLHPHGDALRAALLDEADGLISESVTAALAASDRPSLALGVAMLVGGVIATLRRPDPGQGGGAWDAHADDGREHLTASLNAFLASELTIRCGVAGPSELSLFTHGAIAETYFYTGLDEWSLGLFHFRLAVEMGERVFGRGHPQTQAKVRDTAQALTRLGLVRWADSVKAKGSQARIEHACNYEPGPLREELREQGFIDASEQMGFEFPPG